MATYSEMRLRSSLYLCKFQEQFVSLLLAVVMIWPLLHDFFDFGILEHAHVGLTVLLSMLGFIILPLRKRLSLLETSFLFVFYLGAMQFVQNFTLDPYFFSIFSMGLYFVFLGYLESKDSNFVSRSVPFLFKIILIFTAFDTAQVSIFGCILESCENYADKYRHSKTLLYPVFESSGRPAGVSGTRYASSALIAAGFIYFFYLKKLFWAGLSVLVLLIYSVGSTILISIIFLIFLERRRLGLLIAFPIGILLAYQAVENRGFDIAIYLNFEILASAVGITKAIIFGDGGHTSRIIWTELRFIGLFFSLGLVAVVLCLSHLNHMRKDIFFSKSLIWSAHIKALFLAVCVIILSGWHYPTLFVFPNFIFFLLFLADYVAAKKSGLRRM